MADVLVGIVGMNPASVLVAARALRPGRVELFCTTQSQPVARALEKQIARDPGADVKLHVWTQNPTLLAAELDSDRVVVGEGDRVDLDITGGTKTMSIGVWSGLRSRLGSRLRAIYLDERAALLEADTGAPAAVGSVIRSDEFLAWTSTTVNDCVWSGPLTGVSSEYVSRQGIAERLVDALAARRPIGAKETIAESTITLPRSLPAGFALKGGRLRGPFPDYFRMHAWLEEFCLVEAHRCIGPRADVHAAMGLQISADRDKDEVDVVLTRGSYLVAIEAKARESAAGTGADLHKRIQKTRRYFGAVTSVIFVQPVWGRRPDRQLADAVDRKVTLVGSDRGELHAAIKRGLGLA